MLKIGQRLSIGHQDQIEIIAPFESASASSIVSAAEKEGRRVTAAVPPRKKKRSYIFMGNGDVYVVSQTPLFLARNAPESPECRLVKIGPGFYMNAGKINDIFRFGDAVATQLRSACSDGAGVLLTRGSTTSRSLVRMDSGMLIGLPFTISKAASLSSSRAKPGKRLYGPDAEESGGTESRKGRKKAAKDAEEG